MPMSMWKRDVFSIAREPLSALTRARRTTLMGGIVVDLVSAPIEPGRYPVRLGAVLGGAQVFLPACAVVEVAGPSLLGGVQQHSDEDFWDAWRTALAGTPVVPPTTPPPWAVESHEARPVVVQLEVASVMGGAAIHQLRAVAVGD